MLLFALFSCATSGALDVDVDGDTSAELDTGVSLTDTGAGDTAAADTDTDETGDTAMGPTCSTTAAVSPRCSAGVWSWAVELEDGSSFGWVVYDGLSPVAGSQVVGSACCDAIVHEAPCSANLELVLTGSWGCSSTAALPGYPDCPIAVEATCL